MKKLIFITQSKGGAGKSILSFLLAEKYREATILDMDDATKTTSLQLAYRKPLQITFLNSNNVIDMGLFNAFLEQISSAKSELIICDLGASISEQLPFYLSDVNTFLPMGLEELGISLELFSVVGGANIFTQTMTYMEMLVKAADLQFTIKVLKNEFYDFTQEQSTTLVNYSDTHKLPVVPFNVSKDKNESTQNRIKEVLKSGKGIANASVFSRMYFQNAINTITV
jgi:hypothetical protein